MLRLASLSAVPLGLLAAPVGAQQAPTDPGQKSVRVVRTDTPPVVAAGVDFAFTPTLSWVNLIQYDNVTETAGVNMRLHWIPEAGREVFFVINHNVEDHDRDNRFRSTASDMTAKVNYTFRF